MVVCEQLGPQLGNIAMMEISFLKGSAAELAGQQTFFADGKGSIPAGSTSDRRKQILLLIRCTVDNYLVLLTFFFFLEIHTNKLQQLETYDTVQNMQNMQNMSYNQEYA